MMNNRRGARKPVRGKNNDSRRRKRRNIPVHSSEARTKTAHTSLADAMNRTKKRRKPAAGKGYRSRRIRPSRVPAAPSRAGVKKRPDPRRVAQKKRRALTPRERALLEKRRAKYEQRVRLAKKLVLWLVIIAVIVGATWYAGHLIRNSLDDIHQATAEPDPADAYREIPCNKEILSGILEKTATYAGEPVNFTQTLKNSHKKRACYVDAGRSHMYVKVTSGEQLVWDSQACEVGDAERQLLIGAGREGKMSIRWPGIVAGEKCEGKNSAEPGTYVAQFYWNGQPLGEKQVFELASAPPKPEKSDAKEK